MVLVRKMTNSGNLVTKTRTTAMKRETEKTLITLVTKTTLNLKPEPARVNPKMTVWKTS